MRGSAKRYSRSASRLLSESGASRSFPAPTTSTETPVRLSAAETTMLAAFARAPGQRLAYWQIAEILGLDAQSYAKASLEVRIVRLRKKMAEAGVAGDSIEAVRGYGYQLCTGVQVL